VEKRKTNVEISVGCSPIIISANGLWLCVCYFGLQTLAFKDKFYSQNNSTKPLLVAGAVN
jgi:hypothetical protein